MSDFDLLGTDDAPVRVDAEAAATGLADGSLRAGRALRLRHSSGRIAEIAPDRVGDALRSGRFVLDTPEDAERRQFARDQNLTTEGVTAAASLLREGSLGLSELGEEALGIREEVDRMREANPTAATLGDIAGLIAPALATGGASAEARALAEGAQVAREGAEGASLLSRAARAVTAPARGALTLGERAGGAVTRALAPEGAALGRLVLGRAAGGAVEGGLQGAAFEGGHILTEDALGEDPGDVADRMIASTGLGAVLGGGLFGAGALLGEGLAATRRTGAHVADLARRQYATATGRELDDGVASLMGALADASGAVSGRDAGAIRSLTRLDAAGQRARQVIERGDEAIQEGTRALTDALDRALRASEHVTGEITGSLKTSSVERVIGGDLTQQAETAVSALQRVRSLVASIEADGGLAGGIYGQGARAGGARLSEAARVAEDRIFAALRGDALSEAQRGAQLFSAIDDLKRQVGRARRYARERYAQEAIDGLYADLRSPLENAETWGEGAAALQRESNAPWTRYLNWSGDFDRAFLREGESIAGAIGDRLAASDSARVDAFLRQLGTAGNESREQVFRDALAGLGELNESALRHFNLSPEASASAAELRTALRRVQDVYERVGDDARVLNQWRAIGGGSGNMGALQIGGLGALALGPIGGVAGLLASPSSSVRMLGAIERMVRGTDGRIASSVRSFLTGGRETARRGASIAARATRRAASTGVQAYRERIARLDESHDAGRRAAELAESTGPLGRAAPRIQRAVQDRASQADAYLRGVRPRGMTTRGTLVVRPREHVPSRHEIDRFMRSAQAVDDPQSVIDGLAHGELTREGVDALRAVYPALYQRLVRQVVDDLARGDVDPSYQTRIQLGMLLGVPTDPSLAPESIAMLQMTHALASPTPQATATQRVPDIASAYASDTDRIAARRALG